MAQVSWVYLDNKGGRHKVGLYHGDQTGHLMIHCNLRVVQIDFSVKEPKVYSFFIEDEFIEVHLTKEKGLFYYEFRVNKEVDTPRNRERKIFDKRTRKQLTWFILGFIAIIGLFVLFLNWNNRRQKLKQLAKHSLVTVTDPALLQQLQISGDTISVDMHIVNTAKVRRIVYGFVTPNFTRVSNYFYAPDTGAIVLPTGMTLKEGDTFEARYLPEDPEKHRVDFNNPGVNTLKRYIQEAIDVEHKVHPEKGRKVCVCEMLTIAEKKDWKALQFVLNQQRSPEDKDAYLRLVREPELAQEIKEKCWDVQ